MTPANAPLAELSVGRIRLDRKGVARHGGDTGNHEVLLHILVGQCTIEASDSDFRGMIDGGMQAAMSLFFSGKLKVSGDATLATKLSKLLAMAK